LPLEASTGLGAGEGGEGGLAGHPGGIAAGDDELGGADRADAALGEQLGHERRQDRLQLAVELGELGVEVEHAPAEPAQHAAHDRLLALAPAQARGRVGELLARLSLQAGAQPRGRGHDQRLQLVERRGAGADRAAPLEQQKTQILARAAQPA
jgi:hypothetical protein